MFLTSGNCSIRATGGNRSTVSLYHRGACSVVFLSRGVPNLGNLRALTRVDRVHPGAPIIVVAGDRRRGVVSVTVNGGVTSCLVGPMGPGRVLLALGGRLRGQRVVDRRAAIGCHRRFTRVNVRVSSGLSDRD